MPCFISEVLITNVCINIMTPPTLLLPVLLEFVQFWPLQMAYTVNTHMLQLNGTYWMQQPRVATVKQAEPMINAVKQALINYKTNSGHFPEHVFVFRAGASEGEYKKVRRWGNWENQDG